MTLVRHFNDPVGHSYGKVNKWLSKLKKRLHAELRVDILKRACIDLGGK